jgi:translation elongation factor EF-Tu-like GTPase
MTSEIEYDFTAMISLFPTENGGRKRPVYSHYRPSFSFNTKMHFCGEILFLNKEEVMPGDIAVASVRLLPARYIRRNLKSGDAFTILEGSNIVGSGVIQNIEKNKEVPVLH